MEMHILSGTLLDNIKKNIYYNKQIPEDWSDNLKKLATTAVLAAVRYTDPNSEENLAAEPIHIDPRVFHAAIGIATEGTELIEALYTSISNNIELDTVNILEEMFDVFWYMCIGHDAMNASIEQTLSVGFEKLRNRYPDKFTQDHAINRNLESEREILEHIKDPKTY
jgi:hypothetical protein